MLLQFKIQLARISKPPVWRRVLVPDNFTFEKFHLVIQAAFGWHNCHLYQFSPQGYGSYPAIGIPDDEGWSDEEISDSAKIKLFKIFDTVGQRFTYNYDFGDDWMHKIILEEVKEGAPKKAELLAGKSACPPEDCGGPWGYQRMLEVLANPKDEEYESMREWVGLTGNSEWDIHEFDLDLAQRRVQAV
ncbi:plasmid pRiA4b ORF-3 family protein [Parafilimonas sp.]|uniref:plasmid pRiA4b ORF-3 family protein n=1 Tax=Parafilimonas sp. TaxID=1969739 RepID=UPI0039E33333